MKQHSAALKHILHRTWRFFILLTLFRFWWSFFSILLWGHPGTDLPSAVWQHNAILDGIFVIAVTLLAGLGLTLEYFWWYHYKRPVHKA
jgi:hypothetical protein